MPILTLARQALLRAVSWASSQPLGTHSVNIFPCLRGYLQVKNQRMIPLIANAENENIEPNSGSFRDPINRIYEGKGLVLRGLNEQALATYNKLATESFFLECLKRKQIINTTILSPDKNKVAIEIMEKGWAGVLSHSPIPFISYPYEWPFSMLKDAAMLHLHLLEKSLENSWTLKDATPFNIQWVGAHPTFIDIPSFEPWVEGDSWFGYRQFCAMFLIPLMLKAHVDINYIPLLRSQLDGIEPTEAIKYFHGINRFKAGVLSHIYFPAKVEQYINKREQNTTTTQKWAIQKQSKARVLGLVQSVARLVKGLKIDIGNSAWSQYNKNHSYEEIDFSAKKAFVLKHVSCRHWKQVWDIGCNTGVFSKLCCDHADHVISVDGDQGAVENLYLSEKNKDHSKILSLVMNLSNLSPNQGWRGQERTAFDNRKKPDLVLCLALIHHIRISANIPLTLFFEWLHSLKASILIEFVNRDDEMVIKLLQNKKETYEDYSLKTFISESEKFFNIVDRQILKDGNRELFFLTPVSRHLKVDSL